jgi:hypothetical protein
MPDEAALASECEDCGDYERHLAAEIIAMLPYDRADALRVLRLVDAILNLAPKPQLSEPQPPSDDA